MGGFSTKTWVVQRRGRDGSPGEVVGVKLSFGAAHALAKKMAPAIVVFSEADKGSEPNVVELSEGQPLVKLISNLGA